MINIIKILRLPVLATMLVFLTSTNIVHAAVACGERDKFTKHLNTKYKEQPRALGVLKKGNAIFEVFVSMEGSWTLLMTMTNGSSCIMAAGHSWQERDKLAYLPKS